MLLLGVVQAQAAGDVSFGSYDLLATTILTSSASSVTFSSLGDYATDYQHLQMRMVARGTNGNNFSTFNVRFNADTGSNYAFHPLYGNGSSVQSNQTGTSQTSISSGFSIPGNLTTGTFGAVVADILDPFKTTKYTTTRWLGGRVPSNDTVIELRSGLWMNTSALTSLVVTGVTANFDTGSRFSLYGIKAV
jgi:hypothetical protein